jgi:acyl-CoA reductase-like NAD-dependent aldehyde dehydrogenase
MPRRVRTNPDPGAIRSLTEESVMLYQTVNPATGALVETFAPIGDYELEKVLATAHNTFEIDWRRGVDVPELLLLPPKTKRSKDKQS